MLRYQFGIEPAKARNTSLLFEVTADVTQLVECLLGDDVLFFCLATGR